MINESKIFRGKFLLLSNRNQEGDSKLLKSIKKKFSINNTNETKLLNNLKTYTDKFATKNTQKVNSNCKTTSLPSAISFVNTVTHRDKKAFFLTGKNGRNKKNNIDTIMPSTNSINDKFKIRKKKIIPNSYTNIFDSIKNESPSKKKIHISNMTFEINDLIYNKKTINLVDLENKLLKVRFYNSIQKQRLDMMAKD